MHGWQMRGAECQITYYAISEVQRRPICLCVGLRFCAFLNSIQPNYGQAVLTV